MKAVTTLLAFLLILLPGRLSADGLTDRYYKLRETEIRQFTADLFIAGDYFRAITEARRYLSLFPDGPQSEAMARRIGDAYLLSHEWADAVAAYDAFLLKYPGSTQAGAATFYKAIALIKLGDAAGAERLFRLVQREAGLQKRGEAARWEILLLIRQNRFDEAERRLKDEMVRPVIEESAGAIEAMIREKKKARYKSPEAAGALSALLPGSGQFYIERYQDGVYSFLLNTLFILGAYKAFDQQNHALGGLLTLFEIGWYSGGIYGAIGGAHKHNQRIDEDHFQNGVRQLNLRQSEIGRPAGASILFTYPF